LGLGDHRLQILVGLLGAVFVVGLGKTLLSRRASLTESTPV